MIALIVAVGPGNVMGKEDSLPWHYPEDLKYFKAVTLNKTVVMGRKTFCGILRKTKNPLPQRKIVVVTRDLNYTYPGVAVVHDLIAYLKNAKEDIYIAGGREIYEQALNYAERLYITRILKSYPGDVFFPEINYQEFKIIGFKKSTDLEFLVYERIKQ